MPKKNQPEMFPKKRGPKKTGLDIRSVQVHCSLTPDDAEYFKRISFEMGFDSRSQMITAILERLKMCEFSPIGALRMAAQIQDKYRTECKKKGKKLNYILDTKSLFSTQPFPPLPEDAPFDQNFVDEQIHLFQQESKKQKKHANIERNPQTEYAS